MKYITILNDQNQYNNIISKGNFESHLIYAVNVVEDNYIEYTTSNWFIIIGAEDDMMYQKMKDDTLVMYEIIDDVHYNEIVQYITHVSNLSMKLQANNHNIAFDYIMLNHVNNYQNNRYLFEDYNLQTNIYSLRNNLENILSNYRMEAQTVTCFIESINYIINKRYA